MCYYGSTERFSAHSIGVGVCMELLDVRRSLTQCFNSLSAVFSTDEVIAEVMHLRRYATSPYRDSLFAYLKAVGIFKVDSLYDILLTIPGLTVDVLKLFGFVTDSGAFLLDNRYIIPIRDIMGNVTALTGWYPDTKKYITTPTYGFSKEGQFFGMETFQWSHTGGYLTPVDAAGEPVSPKGLTYLVEGIFDALSLQALGFPALANMGLTMSSYKSEILRRYGKVVVIPDNDKAGATASPYRGLFGRGGSRDSLRPSASSTAWRITNENVVMRLPDGIKDVDDLIKGYLCLDDLVAAQGAQYIYSVKLS